MASSRKAPASDTDMPLVLTGKSQDGTSYTLDVETGQWVAEIDGKATRSKDFHTLKDRVDKRIAKAPRSTGGSELALVDAEVLVQSISTGSSNKERSFLAVKPVQVKLAETADGVQIIRYKAQGDAGWASRDADRLKVVDASLLNGRQGSVFQDAALWEAIDERVVATGRRVHEWWLSQKSDHTQFFEVSHQGKLIPRDTEDAVRMASSMSSRHLLGSTQWPMHPREAFQDKAEKGWQGDGKGRLVRGDVRILMRIQYSPSFHLETRVEGKWVGVRVGESRTYGNNEDRGVDELSVAMVLASVIDEATKKSLPVIAEWRASVKQTSRAHGMKPFNEPNVTQSIIGINLPRDREMAHNLVLSQGEEGLCFELRESYQPTELRMLPTGPEDAAMQRFMDLAARLDAERQESPSAKVTREQRHGKNNKGSHVLREAYDARVEEEASEVPDIAGQLAKWETAVRTLKNRVLEHPKMKEVVAACEQIEALCVPPVARRRPGP